MLRAKIWTWEGVRTIFQLQYNVPYEIHTMNECFSSLPFLWFVPTNRRHLKKTINKSIHQERKKVKAVDTVRCVTLKLLKSKPSVGLWRKHITYLTSRKNSQNYTICSINVVIRCAITRIKKTSQLRALFPMINIIELY